MILKSYKGAIQRPRGSVMRVAQTESEREVKVDSIHIQDKPGK
jgi:hypothetical protein